MNFILSFFEENIENLDKIPYLVDKVLPKVIAKIELEVFPQKLKQVVAYWLSEGFKTSKSI